MAKKKLIDLYPYRIIEGKPQFLLLLRSKGHIYHKQWRMIGGKVEKGETSWQAALRELKEETALPSRLFWSVPSVNHFYEPETDQIHLIPAFAVEISAGKEPILNREHKQFEWLEIDKAQKRIIWPEQHRLLSIIHNIVTRNEIPDEWIIKNHS